MSRIESGRLTLRHEEFSFSKTLEQVNTIISGQCRDESLEYECHLEGNISEYYVGDDMKLRQILINILGNAVKFTPEGGRVSLDVKAVAHYEGKSTLRFVIRDTGIGMTQEFAERIFAAFERERTSTVSGIEGTGLGMAITKAIVDLMGGTVQIITAPGEGTEFIITLSLALADESLRETDEQQEALAAARADFSGKRILLVEDNAINLETARLILEEAGFELECATNGKEALDMVSQAEPGHYDAVLTDVQMPVMDGYEEARAIRALPDPQRANVPIFAVTANAFAEDVAAAEAAGMNGHLAKPLDVDKVMHTLAKLFVEQQEK
jgi:CheY-like chemotaxis protein